MNRQVTVRTLAACIVLTLAMVVLAFQLGLLDALIQWRARRIAQEVNTEYENTWFGVRVLQYPNDLMIYQQLINQLRPDLIIETGTDWGGSAVYMATILESVNPEGKIISIDIDRRHWDESMSDFNLAGKDKLLSRIEFVESDSLAPSCIDNVAKQAKEAKTVLVLLDSLHTKKQVLAELKAYSPFVTPGSYIIVNDTHLEGLAQGDTMAAPLSAVREFLKENPSFQVDEELERFNISCAHSGYIKRTK